MLKLVCRAYHWFNNVFNRLNNQQNNESFQLEAQWILIPRALAKFYRKASSLAETFAVIAINFVCASVGRDKVCLIQVVYNSKYKIQKYRAKFTTLTIQRRTNKRKKCQRERWFTFIICNRQQRVFSSCFATFSRATIRAVQSRILKDSWHTNIRNISSNTCVK